MKPFTPDDLYLHQEVSELDCVQGEDFGALTLRCADRENDGYLSCLWAFGGDAPPRQLTHGPGRDNSPHWSPDGRTLAFLSDRAGGAAQIHLLERDGGEARALGRFGKGVSRLGWMPGGQSLLASAAVAAGAEGPAEVVLRLPYKADGVGFLLARNIHLFRIDAASGESTQLTQGSFDVNAFAPSPDGRHVAFSRTRDGRYAHCSDLWVCDPDGGGARQLTHELSMVLQPAWSPDGLHIAFGGAVKEGDGETGLWLLEFSSGRLRQLGPGDLELADPQSLRWSQDGRTLWLVRANRGRHEIAAVGLDGEVRTVLGGDRQLGAFGCTGRHFYFGVDTPAAPGELHRAGIDGAGERTVSDFNGWWKERTPLQLQARSFEVPDGRGGTETIEGWLLRAAGQALPAPLLSDAHGGPAAYALLDYGSAAYRQVLCSRGWSVLMLNPVGSSSFGKAFCARLSGHWGELDLPQHLAALDALREEGICDARIALAGKSYGGYLASWAVGHTDRYRAAVVMAPVGNIETHYGTSDGGYYADPLYLHTAPAFDREKARALSPLQSIERGATPTLFIQGKEDERCPKCQSEELFVSMYRTGRAACEMVLYPGEGHTFLGDGKPAVRADANRRIAEWVERHVRDAAP